MSEHAPDPVSAAPAGAGGDTADGRLIRGARSRRTILRHAVDVASLEGLNGLSLGRLAADLGFSKSGVQTLFGTKENLQTATAETAAEVFHEAVVRPALDASPGEERLRALLARWFDYAEQPLFPGGCFWAANLADFDSRPGRVRDVLVRQQREWRGLLAAELRCAFELRGVSELPRVSEPSRVSEPRRVSELRCAAGSDEAVAADADLAAFQIDAVLMAANSALRLGDAEAVNRARRLVDTVLSPAP